MVREVEGGREGGERKEERVSCFDTLILLQLRPYLSTSFLSQSF